MATPINQSVVKAFAVLEAFQNAQGWLSSVELARRARLPESSCYRLAQSLVQVGALVRGPRGGFGLGAQLASLASNIELEAVWREAAMPVAADIALRLNTTVHLGILEDEMVSYVVKASGPDAIETHTQEGAQLEAYCSAIGKVLLAGLKPAVLESTVLKDGLIALTPHTITDKQQLRQTLADVRLNGFAVDDRESSLAARCVAAPVKDGAGRTLAALSATEPAAAMSDARRAALLEALQQGAQVLRARVVPKVRELSILRNLD